MKLSSSNAIKKVLKNTLEEKSQVNYHNLPDFL